MLVGMVGSEAGKAGTFYTRIEVQGRVCVLFS